MPFADDFSRLAKKHSEVLASGKAFVSGMGKGKWDVEPDLKPRGIAEKGKRTGAFFRNISRIRFKVEKQKSTENQ
jgi:hypothetical protein